MIRRIQFSPILMMAMAAFLALSSSASAQSEKRGFAFDLFGAEVRPTDSDSDFATEAFGVRGQYRFSNVWALEGSVSRLSDVDLWFHDASAKAYFVHSDRFEIYALAGAGAYRLSSITTDATVHAAIGAEINVGEKAYLRPEVRGRWLAEEARGDDGIVDYSLGFGWRF